MLPGISGVRVRWVERPGAGEYVIKRGRSSAELGPFEDVRVKLYLDLHVCLRPQARNVSRNQHVEVVACSRFVRAEERKRARGRSRDTRERGGVVFGLCKHRV